MDWAELGKYLGVVTTALIAVGSIMKFLIRKPVTEKEKVETAKLKTEYNILQESIKEDSVKMIKDGYESLLQGSTRMLKAQEDIIETLREEISTLRMEMQHLREDNTKLWKEVQNLKSKKSKK